MKPSIFLRSATALLLIGRLWGDPSTDNIGGTGALPLSAEQLAELETSVGKVIHFKLNFIGRERVLEQVRSQGLPEDLIPPPEEGLETIVIQATSQDALQTIPSAAALPRSVDNSKLACFPPIGHQHELSSCVGFASTYYQASHEIGLLNGLDNKSNSTGVLSPKWTYNLINNGADAGAQPVEAFNLLSDSGAPSILNIPYDSNYTEWSTNPNDWVNAISNRMAPYTFIPGLGGYGTQNLTAIKQALTNGHIVSFTTYINSWNYTKILNDPSFPNSPYVGQWAAHWMNGTKGSHHITIVGYDDDLWIDVNGNGQVDPGERGAFLVANSWGTGWGNKGFMWISYDAFLGVSAVTGGPTTGRVPAGTSNSGVYLLTPKAPFYTPTLVGLFSLSQTARNEFSIVTGASSSSATVPSATALLTSLFFQGGTREFDGSTPTSIPQTATFAADFSDYLTQGDQTPLQNYYLTVRDAFSGRPTTLGSFSLVDQVNQRSITSPQTPLSIDAAAKTLGLTFRLAQDVTPPTVSFSSPANGATLKGTVQLTAAAQDNVSVESVEFSIDSLSYKTVSTAPFTTVLDTRNIDNGTHKLQATAMDKAGNKSTATITVSIQNDLKPPTIKITYPPTGTTVNGNVTLSTDVSDDVGIASVAFYADAMPLEVDTTSPYSTVLDTHRLSNGMHEIRAVATDTSNNQSTASIQVNVQNVSSSGFYVNAGGPTVSFEGTSWVLDDSYETGSQGAYTVPIRNANPIYDTTRYGNLTYSFDVDEGNYEVTLKFVENYYNAPKKRVFNVALNGKRVISNLDIFAKVGFKRAYDVSFPVRITRINKRIVIQFSGVKEWPLLAGIQITRR